MTTDLFAANTENWHTISTQYPSVQIKQFPAAVITALKASNAKLIAAEKARSPMAKRIIESREDYLTKARAWTNIGDKLYLDSVAD
jgi:TRAP-type mannitol/chloroaromatic compound transport system substrate-binding protein